MITGLAIIAVGVVLLLINLGVVGPSMWLGVIELWPVAIIAIGVALLLPRDARTGRIVLAAVTLVALGVGGWAMSERDQPLRGRSADVGVALGSAQRAEVDIDVGAGRLRLTDGADPGEVVSGTVGLGRGQRLVATGGERGDLALVRVAAEGRWFRLGVNPTSVEPWALAVTDSVPLLLRVSTGVGEASLDLSNLALDEARVDVGVGRTAVRLPGEGTVRVRIEGGIGESIVTIPEGIAARITINTGIGAATVDEAFVRDGDVYQSPGWESASDRLDIVVDTGVGAVRVRRAPQD